MIIDRSVIDKLAKKNQKVADLLSEIAEMQEEQLLSINEEIQKVRAERKKKIKKDNSLQKSELKLSSSLNSFEKLLNKSHEDKHIKISIPKIVYPKIQSKQSSQNFDKEDKIDYSGQRIHILKDISRKLDFEGSVASSDNGSPKKEENSGGLSLLSSIGAGAGAGLLLKAGKRALPFVGLAFSLKSAYDLFGTIKTGISDYNKFKAAGDNVSANNVLFKSSIGGVGNLLNIAAGFLPGPIGLLLGLAGSFLEYTSDNFDEIKSDKSNSLIQDQNTVAKVQDLLENGQKNQILQLKPDIHTMGWLYKDYASDDWVPLIDQKTGKQLSITEGNNRVVADQSGKNGVQTYKLKTDSNGLVELSIKNGQPQIKMGDNYSPISTRKDGGKVQGGNQYLVGEDGPEKYQRNGNSDNQANDMNKVLKKLVDRFDIKKIIESQNVISDLPFQFFSPTESTTYSIKNGSIYANDQQIKISFNDVPTDSKERFDQFVKQILSEEGGYSNRAEDKGGATNFGITQTTLKAYNKKNNLDTAEDVKNLTEEKAKQIYYDQYYKGTGVDKMSDPKVAYFYFNAFVNMYGTAMSWKKKNIMDLPKLMDLQKQKYLDNVKKDSTQAANINGWMNRLKRLEAMFSQSPKQTPIEIKNPSVLVAPPVIRQSGVDRKFMINTIALKLAEVVSNKFGE